MAIRDTLAPEDAWLISDEELLLIFNTTRSGDFYISDSTDLGKTYTLGDVLDEAGDHCPRILVLNTRTLKSSDVTEMFAAAWLRRADKKGALEIDAEISLEDLEAGFPDYVTNSRAWAIVRDDIEAEQSVNRPYSTLNNRTQGTGRAHVEAVR